MADTVDKLKELAKLIRYASVSGENTAERVGRVLVGILETANVEELEKIFLRKDQPEQTSYLFKLLGGVEVENGLKSDSIVSNDFSSDNFSAGALGAGLCVKVDPKTGKSYIEVDELFVRIKAIFTELVIEKLSHVGGQILLTPARMICIKVEELDSAYRCFFESTDGEKTINNEFVVDDQATIREFNIKPGVHQNVSNRYYWRLVTGIGNDYIDLSKTDCDSKSDVPAVGDDICQLGNRTDKSRQNAIILSSYGIDSPSFKQYAGINSYSLSGKEVTKLSPAGNRIVGDFILTNGKDVLGALAEMQDSFDSSVSSAKRLALAMSRGKMLFEDPVFAEGQNGLKRYNNGAGSVTTLSRVKDEGCPNDSGYVLSVTTADANATPGLGGVTWQLDGKANMSLVMRIVAKIPIGYTLHYIAQSLGEQTFEWLTPVAGTGDWQEFAVYVKYKDMPASSGGAAHIYKKCGYFYLSGETVPVTWKMAYATIFDVNGVAPAYAVKSEVASEFKVLQDRITSEVKSEREFTMMISKGKMLFKDPTFKLATNSIFPFNNSEASGSSAATVSLKVNRKRFAGAPNDSGHVLEFECTSLVATPEVKLGGFSFPSVYVESTGKYLIRLLANIPVNYTLELSIYDGVQSDKIVNWVNGNRGVGDWQEYLVEITACKFNPRDIYFRLYLKGAVLPVTWQMAYATVYDVNGADPEYTSKATFESKVTQLSDRITSEVKGQQDLKIAGGGKMLYKDPTFRDKSYYNGFNYLLKQDTTGTLTLERLYDDSYTVPNDSGYYLGISAPAGVAPEGAQRWVRWNFASKAGATFSIRLLAKVPKGRRLQANTYNIGKGSQKWLTSDEGTGEWQEYLYLMNFGMDATVKEADYVTLKLDPGTVTAKWYIAYGTVYDLNGSDPIYTEKSYTDSKITQLSDRITSEVNKTVTQMTEYANAMQQGTMLYKDPTFVEGTNGMKQFSPNGEDTNVRLLKVTNCPNDSGYALSVNTPSGSGADKKNGGVRWETYGKPGMSVVIRIVAKIPLGLKLAPGISSMSYTTHGWLTPNVSTGGWQEYIYKIKWASAIPVEQNLSYGVFYLEKAVAPVSWQIAYATIFDMNGQNPEIALKKEFNSKVTQLSDRITSEVKEVQTNTLALQRGELVYEDPTFKDANYLSGRNGLKVYDNSNSGAVLITRELIARCPNDSGYGLVVSTSNSAAKPGFGGVAWRMQGKPNKYYIVRFVAKIPSGNTLSFTSNDQGNLDYHGWVSERKGLGTSRWEEYVYQIKCGELFAGTTAFFYISGNKLPVTWQIAYAGVYDMNGESQLTWKTEYSSKINQLSNEIDMTVKAIGEKVSGSQIKLNPDKIKMAVFGDDGTGKPNSMLSAINMDKSGVQIKGELVEVDADKFVARNVQTALYGPRVEMYGSKIDIYGKVALNIRFGVNNEGYAVLQYYDNDGTRLYDLGPNGIFQLPSSAEVWEEVRLKRCGDTLADTLTSSQGYKAPHYATGVTYYRYISKVAVGVVQDPENNGKLFRYNGNKTMPIPNGCYCSVPISQSAPKTYWTEIQTNNGMEIGSTGRQLTERDFEELHPWNEPIYDRTPLFSIGIYEYSSGRSQDGCYAFWNG